MRSNNENLDARGKSRVQTVFKDESLTVQSDAHRADIQEIMKQFHNVGIVSHLNKVEGKYLDVSEFTDFADLQNQLAIVEQEFMSLPSKVREIFGHDVAKFLDAAHDPDKRQKLVDAGIIADTGIIDPGPSPARDIAVSAVAEALGSAEDGSAE